LTVDNKRSLSKGCKTHETRTRVARKAGETNHSSEQFCSQLSQTQRFHSS